MIRLLCLLALIPSLAFGATTVVSRAVVANTNNLIISHTNLTLNGTATVYAVKFGDGTALTSASAGTFTNLNVGGSNYTTRAVLKAGTSVTFTHDATSTTINASGIGGDMGALSNGLIAVGAVASNAVAQTGGLYYATSEWQLLLPDDAGLVLQYPGTSAASLSGGGSGLSLSDGIATLSTTGTVTITAAKLNIESEADLTGRSITNGFFRGDGSGLTNLNASSLASGTIPDARLATNSVRTMGGLNTTGTVTAARWDTGVTVTNYQWIEWLGTNPVRAVLVSGSGGITGWVRRISGADYITAP